MVVQFEGTLGIAYPPYGGIVTGRRAHPCHREVVESPSLDGDFVVFRLEYRKAEFVDGEPVAKCGDHAQFARTSLDRSRFPCARLGFGSGLLRDSLGGGHCWSGSRRWSLGLPGSSKEQHGRRNSKAA